VSLRVPFVVFAACSVDVSFSLLFLHVPQSTSTVIVTFEAFWTFLVLLAWDLFAALGNCAYFYLDFRLMLRFSDGVQYRHLVKISS